MHTEQLNKKVQLVSGSFTPSEVSNLILKSIDNQINNFKLKNLSNWIHDHNCDQEVYTDQIKQLEHRKQELETMIQEAQNAGCNLVLTDSLEITFEN
jgi:hypothetical protein